MHALRMRRCIPASDGATTTCNGGRSLGARSNRSATKSHSPELAHSGDAAGPALFGQPARPQAPSGTKNTCPANRYEQFSIQSAHHLGNIEYRELHRSFRRPVSLRRFQHHAEKQHSIPGRSTITASRNTRKSTCQHHMKFSRSA